MDCLDGHKSKMASETREKLRIESRQTVVLTEDDIQHGVAVHPNIPVDALQRKLEPILPLL